MTTPTPTPDLTYAALDWAVAKCVGENMDYWFEKFTGGADRRALLTKYSTNWSQGGPIIEREKYNLNYDVSQAPDVWQADDGVDNVGNGPTPLIAAMRCYVASKLGDEVDIPEELSGVRATIAKAKGERS